MSKTIYNGGTPTHTYSTGTAHTFEEVPSNGKGTLYVDDTTTSLQKATVRLTGRPGNIPTGLKQKATAVYSQPVEDATTGDVRYATVRIEVTFDSRDSDELAQLQNAGCQILSETEFAKLFTIGQEG